MDVQKPKPNKDIGFDATCTMKEHNQHGVRTGSMGNWQNGAKESTYERDHRCDKVHDSIDDARIPDRFITNFLTDSEVAQAE